LSGPVAEKTPATQSQAPHATRSDAAELEIRLMEQGEEDECDRFVSESAMGTPFHLSAWRNLVEAVLRRRCLSLLARRGNKITGIFPIGLIRSRVFGDSMVSLPLAVYGGICADDAESYSRLLKAGQSLAGQEGVRYLEMRNRNEPHASDLPGRSLYVTFTQDLSLGPDKLLAGLPRDTRYMVRKSIKAGLEWTEDLTLAEFYEIYAQSVHRLGTPVFPRELFARLRKEFPQHSRIFGVRKEKTAIAGVLCLYFRDQVLPYYGGSLAEFAKDAPNNFMYWRLMEQSAREGYRIFDFGRSKRGTGSFQFKSAWAMQVSELPYRYHLVRAREVPHFSPVDSKFHLAVAAWKRLPFAWTKILGPKVIRWVPSV
jgi:FemAB-related protein (PEP-CTERM system-associated)